VDLPTNLAIEDMMQLFKGASSHWINQSKLVGGKFGWGRGGSIKMRPRLGLEVL